MVKARYFQNAILPLRVRAYKHACRAGSALHPNGDRYADIPYRQLSALETSHPIDAAPPIGRRG